MIHLDLPKNKWADFFLTHPQDFSSIPASEKKDFFGQLLPEISNLIARGRIGTALDRLSLLTMIDKELLLHKLKAQNLLRHSAYLYSQDPVSGIARHFLKYMGLFQLNEQEACYFNSLVLFEKLFIQLSKLNREIDAELRNFKHAGHLMIEGGRHKKSRLRSLLVANDKNFLYEVETGQLHDINEIPNDYSNEDISAAISMLVARYNKVIGITEDDVVFADDSYTDSKLIEDLVHKACKLKSILDVEALIEFYAYRLKDMGNKLVLEPLEKSLSMAMELSDIIYPLQDNAVLLQLGREHKETLSMTEIAKFYHQKNPDSFQLKNYPFKRYALKIDTSVFAYFLKVDGLALLQEDLPILKQIETDLLIPSENLGKYQICPGLSLFDFFRLYRFFVMRHHCFAEKFAALSEEEKKIANNALVVPYRKHELTQVLEQFTAKEAVAQFLQVVSWDSASTDSFLDLQYHPIIAVGDFYLVQTTILARSNILRSIFFSENKRQNNFKHLQTGLQSSLQDILEKNFKKQGFLCCKETKVDFVLGTQTSSDIDFLAFKDGILFIAECKDTTHPTDLFEMRTTYNYIKKAKKQLDYTLKALSDKVYLKAFEQKTSIEGKSIQSIVPAIVLSNKKFWGYRYGGYPVIHAKDLCSFMAKGSWNYKLPDEDMYKFFLWKNDYFEAQDLLSYCGTNSPYSLVAKHLIEYESDLKIDVTEKRFALNIPGVIEELKTIYRYTILKEDISLNETTDT